MTKCPKMKYCTISFYFLFLSFQRVRKKVERAMTLMLYKDENWDILGGITELFRPYFSKTLVLV